MEGKYLALLTGKIIDADTKRPIPFINVSVGGYMDSTDQNGVYELQIPEGIYDLRIRAPFYEPITQTITVKEPKTEINITLRNIGLLWR